MTAQATMTDKELADAGLILNKTMYKFLKIANAARLLGKPYCQAVTNASDAHEMLCDNLAAQLGQDNVYHAKCKAQHAFNKFYNIADDDHMFRVIFADEPQWLSIMGAQDPSWLFAMFDEAELFDDFVEE